MIAPYTCTLHHCFSAQFTNRNEPTKCMLNTVCMVKFTSCRLLMPLDKPLNPQRPVCIHHSNARAQMSISLLCLCCYTNGSSKSLAYMNSKTCRGQEWVQTCLYKSKIPLSCGVTENVSKTENENSNSHWRDGEMKVMSVKYLSL